MMERETHRERWREGGGERDSDRQTKSERGLKKKT